MLFNLIQEKHWSSTYCTGAYVPVMYTIYIYITGIIVFIKKVHHFVVSTRLLMSWFVYVRNNVTLLQQLSFNTPTPVRYHRIEVAFSNIPVTAVIIFTHTERERKRNNSLTGVHRSVTESQCCFKPTPIRFQHFSLCSEHPSWSGVNSYV